MLTLLGVAFFCLLTAIGSPDKLLLAGDSTVKVPFVDIPISLLGFIVVVLLLLSVITVYLHIFYGYWLELERERRQINRSLIGTGEQQIESVPSLFYFNGPVPRFLTSLLFYWLVPLVFAAITVKALVRPEIGRPVIYVTALVTFVLAFLQIRRRPDNCRRWWTPLSCAMLVPVIVLMVFSIFNPASFRRPLNLFRAELSKAWLRGIDMRGANGRYANLQGADLSDANLQGADLLVANLQEAKLAFAKLQKADLQFAKLQKADLTFAELQGTDLRYADLQGADLRFADLQEAKLGFAKLQGTDLGYANLKGTTDLYIANLQGANLMGADLRNTNFTRPSQLRVAKNWTSAFYDAKMLKLLGLNPNHNEELHKKIAIELPKRQEK